MNSQRKICTKCNCEKSIDDFYSYTLKSGKPMLHTWCKVCFKEYTKSNKKPNNPKANKKYKLKYRFGLTMAEFAKMLEAQNGVCAICKEPERVKKDSLSVDHDHKTGKVRGLLCGRCNRGIGMFQEDLEMMESARAYLQKFKSGKDR